MTDTDLTDQTTTEGPLAVTTDPGTLDPARPGPAPQLPAPSRWAPDGQAVATAADAPGGGGLAPGPPAPTPPAGRMARLVRGRPQDPAWVRPALLVLLVGTGFLYIWGLGQSGWANSFYSAAVQAGTKSWKAFFLSLIHI